MAYERIDVKDYVTVMDKELYDNLQDGIDENKKAIERLGDGTNTTNNVFIATIED